MQFTYTIHELITALVISALIVMVMFKWTYMVPIGYFTLQSYSKYDCMPFCKVPPRSTYRIAVPNHMAIYNGLNVFVAWLKKDEVHYYDMKEWRRLMQRSSAKEVDQMLDEAVQIRVQCKNNVIQRVGTAVAPPNIKYDLDFIIEPHLNRIKDVRSNKEESYPE